MYKLNLTYNYKQNITSLSLLVGTTVVTPKCTLANSEDPDEMPHHAAFYQGLNCMVRPSEKKPVNLDIITCDPKIYTMDRPDLLYQTRRKNPLVHNERKHIH